MLHFHQFTCLLFAGIFGTALCCQIPQWERISQHAVPQPSPDRPPQRLLRHSLSP